MINASGAMQVCAGQKSGREAAIHAMRNIFGADETDAALLVDASNASNSLKKKRGRAKLQRAFLGLVVVSFNLQMELHREIP